MGEMLVAATHGDNIPGLLGQNHVEGRVEEVQNSTG